MLFVVRKVSIHIEEIFHELGPAPGKSARKGAIAAVVTNPYAGQYVEDLSPAFDELKALGERLGKQLIQHLGTDANAIDSYGKRRYCWH